MNESAFPQPVDWSKLTSGSPLSNEVLDSLAKLAQKQAELEDEKAVLEAKLNDLTDQLREVVENKIPTMMTELGMETFTLKNGFCIDVKKFYAGSIKDEWKERAIAWLREKQLDDILKNDVVVSFGKGEDERARGLIEYLLTQHYQCDHKTGVHPMTLKAFIRERIESGKELPLDMFGVHIGQRSKITRPKQKAE